MKFVQAGRYKSLADGAVHGTEIGQFVVLTGTNGSGKTNLLEAIQQGSVVYDDIGTLPQEKIRFFRLAELTVAIEGPVQGASYKEPWAGLYNNIQAWIGQQHIANMDPVDKENWVRDQLVSGKQLTMALYEKLISGIGKPVSQATIADFQLHGPLIAGVRDPFAASISEVFLTYRSRLSRNQMQRWLHETGEESEKPMSEEEFRGKYGPAPWDLLDETLKIVQLGYSFVPPPKDTESANYEVQLQSTDGDELIRPSDLSSGEKVLLAVAMSLYTGTNMPDAIDLPQILLLDEADASLHPSMVRSLLTVIQEVFVNQFNVRVVLATHSPSTVALAPEESLFVMSKTGARLAKATTDQAMKLLTVGMSSLSVKVENRRQVFVESEYDQATYQALYPLLKNYVVSERSAEFIAVGKKSSGGGCEAVIRLVEELRNAGNETILGIIDRDKRTTIPNNVYCIDDRYTIENLVFDPLLLGTILLREQILTAQDLGLPAETRNFELGEAHAAQIVAAISAKLGYVGDTVDVAYLGGFSVAIPRDFLEKPGHDHESHVLDTFPQLRRFKESLKTEILKRAGGDVPAFIPMSAKNLFEKLLTD